MEQTFTGAQVILDDQFVETPVTVSGGRIVEVGGAVQGQEVDARGLILAPAMVDVHGDAFERQIMPRPGVMIPLDVALLETDRQLGANGIATAYHALTLSWEPGLRSIDQGRAFVQSLARLAPRLTVENRVQLRWETFAFEAIPLIEEALAAPLTPSLAFNDHMSMAMRGFDVSMQDRAFEHSADFTVCDQADPRMRVRMAKRAPRSGLSADDYTERFLQVWERRPEVEATIRRLAGQARAAGAPMLSHDDTQVETRAYYRAIGVTTAEFPMTLAPARDARDHGDAIIFGAPNAMRGGSHLGSLGAGDMIEAGLSDALASDYFYPAMLGAVARLDADRRAARHAIWAQVSSGPARAMGLSDRGSIAVGQRADLVLLEWPDGGTPAVRRTLVAGRTAYLADA